MNLDLSILRGCRTAAGTIATATFLLLLGLNGAQAADSEVSGATPGSPEVTIIIDDVRSGDGLLRVAILAVTDDGREGDLLASLTLPPVVPQTRATLPEFAGGRYLARVHHDVDGDGKMATNLVGMPLEPWGVSNDARGRFGPPKVADMIRDLGGDGGEVLRMTLVH